MSVLSIILNSLVILIALQHVGFLVLEMFFWTKPLGLKVFRQSVERARDSAALAANQGLYNGFLAAGLFWGMFFTGQETAKPVVTFFLICILIAGLYGGLSVSRRIWVIQALPAAIALAILAFG